MVAEATVPLAAFVRNLIKREMAHVNTHNQEFIRVSAALVAQVLSALFAKTAPFS